MSKLHPAKRPWPAYFVRGLLTLLPIIALWPATMGAVAAEQRASWGINPQRIASIITPAIALNHFPPHIILPDFIFRDDLEVRYTIDAALQNEARRLLQKYNPDYGVLVALDPDSGQVLAMASSTRAQKDAGNLTMVNSYPAASISKIITAVAAINENKVAAETVIPFNGKSTSLYKKSVFEHRNTKWTRKYSFAKSFSRSVNSVFGRVGALEVGGAVMLDYAQQLGFNGRFTSDFSFGNGTIEVDPADSWQVAEMASGYTTRNTLSPLHGAVLAATAVNGGNLVVPVLVKSIIGPNGIPLYWHEQPTSSRVMSADTARQLKKMMRTTVVSGSANRSFYRFNRGALKEVGVGGKTGSLTGLAPSGKYDWFVGFAEMGERKIAYAVLCINKKRWYVKSARLAREMLEFYFRNAPTPSADIGTTAS